MECLYIKPWIPEFAIIPPKTIHELSKMKEGIIKNYPYPIVDPAVESQKSKKIYEMGNS